MKKTVRIIAGAALAVAFQATAAPPLPAFNIDIAETSISGISSGAFMAVQFQVAHSSIIKGAGIIAGGPYYCARDDFFRATTTCSCTGEPFLDCKVTDASAEVPALVEATRRFHAERRIDDPANLARQRVVTVVGTADGLVPPTITAQLHAYYAASGMPWSSVSPVVVDGAGHTLPTLDFGRDCGLTETPYIGRCRFDSAKAILDWIYGQGVPLPPAPVRAPRRPTGRFVEFDQRPYLPTDAPSPFTWGNGLDNSGWLYVPAACARGERCRLHIALHGCKQGQNFLPLRPPPGGGLYYGTTFVKNAGYHRWADDNRLVVLYPQAVSIPGRNPNGCWDWWGYTGAHYADRDGVQIRTIRAMVDRLASGRRDN